MDPIEQGRYVFWIMMGMIVGIPIYLAPTFIAVSRKVDAALGVFLLNLLLGWSILGWVGSLVWAVVAKTKMQKIEELEAQARLIEARMMATRMMALYDKPEKTKE